MEEKTISMREHLELQIKHEAEMRAEHVRATAEALRIQAIEYQRRLDLLNHSHDQMLTAQNTFMPREVFEVYKTAVDARLNRSDRQLAMIAGGLALLAVLLKFVPVGFGLIPQ